MMVTITCFAPNAPEIGYLFAKNPASVFQRDFSGGTAWAFYSEVAEDHVTIVLVTEIDTVGLVRGPATLAGLDQYVNDRPYVASSLTSVALNTAFRTAMSGESKLLPDRVHEPLRWIVELPAVACDGDEDLLSKLFTPLGYTIMATRLPLDERFPEWGAADLYQVRLEGIQTIADMLNHLYLLLPVLDNAKHYAVSDDEMEKLVARGGAWLAAHPARELISRRYLRYRRPLIASALSKLVEDDLDAVAEENTVATMEAGAVTTSAAGLGPRESAEPALPLKDTDQSVASTDTTIPAVSSASEARPLAKAKSLGLHEQRLAAVMEAVRAAGARTLVDLGCGEGKLLALALKEKYLSRILGMDVSTRALALARRKLHFDHLPPAQRARLDLIHGSLLYRDTRLAGFDAAALVEVIEHLDAPRLGAMERVVFEHARPRRVIVTTPNRDYNAHWESLDPSAFRHEDHRFEWTRADGRAWADRVAEVYGYTTAWQELGPIDGDLGAPSQLMIFDLAPSSGDSEPSQASDATEPASPAGRRRERIPYRDIATDDKDTDQ